MKRINEEVFRAVRFAVPGLADEEKHTFPPIALRYTPRSLERGLKGMKQDLEHSTAALEQSLLGELSDVPIEQLQLERERLSTHLDDLEEMNIVLDRAEEALDETFEIFKRAYSEKPPRVLEEVVAFLRDEALLCDDFPSKEGGKILNKVADYLQASSQLAARTPRRVKSFADEHWRPLVNHALNEVRSQQTENSGVQYAGQTRLNRIYQAQVHLGRMHLATSEQMKLLQSIDVVTGVWKVALYTEAHKPANEQIFGFVAKDPMEFPDLDGNEALKDYIEQVAESARADLNIRSIDNGRSSRGRGEGGLSF